MSICTATIIKYPPREHHLLSDVYQTLPQCHREVPLLVVSKCLETYLVNHLLPSWYHHLDPSVLHLHHNNNRKREPLLLAIHLIYVKISRSLNGIFKMLKGTLISLFMLLYITPPPPPPPKQHVNFNLSQQHQQQTQCYTYLYTPTSSPLYDPEKKYTNDHFTITKNTHFTHAFIHLSSPYTICLMKDDKHVALLPFLSVYQNNNNNNIFTFHSLFLPYIHLFLLSNMK